MSTANYPSNLIMTPRLDHKITRSGDHRQIRDQITRSRSFEPEKSARGSGAPLPRAGLTHRSDSRRETAVEEWMGGRAGAVLGSLGVAGSRKSGFRRMVGASAGPWGLAWVSAGRWGRQARGSRLELIRFAGVAL